MGKWGGGEAVSSPYHPKTLSPYLLPPEQCLRIDQKRDTMIDCSV
ncbi:Similar to A0ZGM6_NODSP Indole-3-glycerol-phosphate synthase (fragment) [Microcystis aeruginosa PCC 9809]|uniref:Similar to A0ZGM6_NODSP Indole-3-glycerol-phosphate synthase n=1 Tax=Microcystis aeruginosa PCC 9809 TaxID=1160285 RepID=I4HGG6_MICAE